MFRRSNSSSNIPLPKVNLFGNKERTGIRRSQSTSRLSQRDSTASTSQLKQTRKSSLDRKSSIPGLSRTTPKTGKTGSLQRTTPTSALSQRTNKSITPSSTLKDRKTIQKLASDKKWVSEQFAKVQNFVMTSSLFDHNKMNVNNLKPPTINIFIEVTGVLFREISPKIKISTENYKEVIPTYLKLLHYPGTMSNSLLKTVNTIHSWPQVIGMWSWLIDRVNIAKCAEDETCLEDLEPEEKKKYLLKKNCWNYLERRYTIFNNDEDDVEKIQEANDVYVNNLAEILGVNFEEFKKLEAQVEHKREYKKKQEVDIANLNAEKEKIRLEIEQMRQEIDDFHEADPVEQKDLDNELEILQLNLKDLRESKTILKTNVNELEEAIRVQSCTFQEKQSLLRQIDDLKDEIRVKREKIEYAQNIKNKFDHTLANEINKIQSLVIQWNRSLMELSIKKPELKKLRLRERGFHNPEFLSEIHEVLKHKISIENEVSMALSRIENELKIKKDQKQDLENNIEELTRIVDQVKEESLVLANKSDNLKKEIKDLLTDLEVKKKSHDQQMMELRENTELKEQTKLISELKKKREYLELEVKKFGQKMLAFFIELHEQVVNNVKEMDSIRRTVTKSFEDRVLNMTDKQNQLIEVLKSFDIKTE